MVSDSVSKKFGIEKSIGFGIEKIRYRKKYRIRYRKNLVSEKSFGFGFVQIWGIVIHCAHVMRPASTIIHPVCSVGFIVNNIPFFSLNFSMVLGIVGQLVSGVFFEFVQPVLVAHECGCGNDSGNKQRGKKACCNTTAATDCYLYHRRQQHSSSQCRDCSCSTRRCSNAGQPNMSKFLYPVLTND